MGPSLSAASSTASAASSAASVAVSAISSICSCAFSAGVSGSSLHAVTEKEKSATSISCRKVFMSSSSLVLHFQGLPRTSKHFADAQTRRQN
jgi:hypothetical protein